MSQVNKYPVDVTCTATLRPELLSRTMRSFEDMVYTDGCTLQNFIINIDRTPVVAEELSIIKQVINVLPHELFQNVIISIPKKPSFAQAVKNVWSLTTSQFVFHLEDDWEMIKRIDLAAACRMIYHDGYDYIRFPKLNADRLGCLDKIALQPSLLLGDVVRILSSYMSSRKDPEKQLRVQNSNSDILNKQIGMIKIADYSNDYYCRDIGREWRDERGLKKWNKNNAGEITWQK